MAAMRTPTLKDITASMIRNARPTRTVCNAVRANPVDTLFAPGLTSFDADNHSTVTERAKIKKRDKRYMPMLRPGHPEKSNSTFLPQKKVICIDIDGILLSGMGMPPMSCPGIFIEVGLGKEGFF